MTPPAQRTVGSMDDTVTRRELLRSGWTVKRIARAVHRAELIRVRRGHYATPATALPVQRAVRVGGRLACVSELRWIGVWVIEPQRLHVHVPPNAARLRHPDDRTVRRGAADCVVHWAPLLQPGQASSSHVGILDALAAAAGCLERRLAIAAIDSALNQGLVTRAGLVAAAAGSRLAGLVAAADGAAQSGLETILRLVALELGLRARPQVAYSGIGVADLVIEEWIVVETDGSEFHDTAVVSPKDRRRDARHAAQGRTALRFRYSQVVHELPTVVEAIIGAVRTHRRVRNSGRLADRAAHRARKLGLT